MICELLIQPHGHYIQLEQLDEKSTSYNRTAIGASAGGASGQTLGVHVEDSKQDPRPTHQSRLSLRQNMSSDRRSTQYIEVNKLLPLIGTREVFPTMRLA